MKVLACTQNNKKNSLHKINFENFQANSFLQEFLLDNFFCSLKRSKKKRTVLDK